MKFIVVQDMFEFAARGILTLKNKDIIHIQAMEYDDEDDGGDAGSVVFYWLVAEDGVKVVDVLVDCAVFDTLADAHAWSLVDLPGFIDMVNADKAQLNATLVEMDEVLGEATERQTEAQAVMKQENKGGKKLKVVKDAE